MVYGPDCVGVEVSLVLDLLRLGFEASDWVESRQNFFDIHHLLRDCSTNRKPPLRYTSSNIIAAK